MAFYSIINIKKHTIVGISEGSGRPSNGHYEFIQISKVEYNKLNKELFDVNNKNKKKE